MTPDETGGRIATACWLATPRGTDLAVRITHIAPGEGPR